MGWRTWVGALLMLGGIAAFFNGPNYGHFYITNVAAIMIGLGLIAWDQSRKTPPRPPT